MVALLKTTEHKAAQLAAAAAAATGQVVDLANLNAVDQVVLSGSRAGVDAAVRMAKEKRWGIEGGEVAARRCRELSVSGAFHSRLT